jgi:hypothetical protein
VAIVGLPYSPDITKLIIVDRIAGLDYQGIKIFDGLEGSTTPTRVTTPTDANAAMAALWIGGQLMIFNGTTWDRARGDITNGLDVDVTRLPALPAGTNNIGDVDVLSSALPTGAATEATLAALAGDLGDQADAAATGNGSLIAVLKQLRVILSDVWDDGGNQLRTSAVVSGGTGTSMIDDAVFTPATSAVTPMGAFADETTPDLVDEGDVGAVRMTLRRALHANLRDASGAELPLPAALGANGGFKIEGVASGTVVPVSGTVTASGPLTDTQLRATPVPVSATIGVGALSTPAAVTVAVTATLLLATNSSRKQAIIVNNGTADMFVGGSGVTTAAGLPLYPGNEMVLPTTSALYAIVASGTQNARVSEIA